MKTKRLVRMTSRWFAYVGGFAAAAYAAHVGYTWLRFGHVAPVAPEEQDALLERFMPVYEVVERHQVRVRAPAAVTFAAACDMNLQQSVVVRSIFKAREWMMRGQSEANTDTRSFLLQARAMGWGVLAEVPDREIVLGAVTQPWMANPVFNPLSPEDFVLFNEPDYVKIVWTLRADVVAPSRSVFRTETRVATTDVTARSKFRRYWSLVSPGVALIRWMLLAPVKAEAERRARETGSDMERTTGF